MTVADGEFVSDEVLVNGFGQTPSEVVAEMLSRGEQTNLAQTARILAELHKSLEGLPVVAVNLMPPGTQGALLSYGILCEAGKDEEDEDKLDLTTFGYAVIAQASESLGVDPDSIALADETFEEFKDRLGF